MNYTRIPAGIATLIGCILLAACMQGPYPGVPELISARSVDARGHAIAPPQVVYRIDEDRHFELVPFGEGACTNATVFYVDEKRGFRSLVVKWDRGAMGGSDFVIDAANEDYLIGPVTRGNTDCSSGGGSCGGARMPYSTDAGRTWKRADAISPTAPISVKGSTAYAIDAFDFSNSIDMTKAFLPMESWQIFSKEGKYPAPIKAPIDSIFHCTSNGKE